jgi:hypothetical protein
MPDLRPFVISLGVGFGIGAYTVLWWHWPLALGGGIGIVLAGLMLLGTIAIGGDPGEADAAWRAAAPDLQEPPADPLPVTPDAGGRVSRS